MGSLLPFFGVVLLDVLVSSFLFFMFRIPGKSYHGHVPPLTDEQIVLREQLRKDVTELAGEIGDRNVNTEYENLCKASDFIEKSFVDAGCKVSRQCYEVSQFGLEGRECYNLEEYPDNVEREKAWRHIRSDEILPYDMWKEARRQKWFIELIGPLTTDYPNVATYRNNLGTAWNAKEKR